MKYSKPWMDDSEINTIIKYLNKEDIMLEWGSGGSTNYFPQFVKEYYSIPFGDIPKSLKGFILRRLDHRYHKYL